MSRGFALLALALVLGVAHGAPIKNCSVIARTVIANATTQGALSVEGCQMFIGAINQEYIAKQDPSIQFVCAKATENGNTLMKASTSITNQDQIGALFQLFSDGTYDMYQAILAFMCPDTAKDNDWVAIGIESYGSGCAYEEDKAMGPQYCAQLRGKNIYPAVSTLVLPAAYSVPVTPESSGAVSILNAANEDLFGSCFLCVTYTSPFFFDVNAVRTQLMNDLTSLGNLRKFAQPFQPLTNAIAYVAQFTNNFSPYLISVCTTASYLSPPQAVSPITGAQFAFSDSYIATLQSSAINGLLTTKYNLGCSKKPSPNQPSMYITADPTPLQMKGVIYPAQDANKIKHYCSPTKLVNGKQVAQDKVPIYLGKTTC